MLDLAFIILKIFYINNKNISSFYFILFNFFAYLACLGENLQYMMGERAGLKSEWGILAPVEMGRMADAAASLYLRRENQDERHGGQDKPEGHEFLEADGFPQH